MVLFEWDWKTGALLQMLQRFIVMMLAMWSALMLARLGDGLFLGNRYAA
jgi:hypothetical protein